jgi:phosphate:Na+ symporter
VSLLVPAVALAQTPVPAVLGWYEWLHIAMGLVGGMAIFMLGMEQLSNALRILAGEEVKQILWRVTRTKTLGLVTGAFVTAMVQSSSVTTTLIVGFISARLMSLAQSLSVILGAGIGASFTAQIIAFNIDHYALIPISLGFFLSFISKGEKKTQAGVALMGLGFIFFGVGMMSGAMGPLKNYPAFTDAMSHMTMPILGILAGAAFTALVRSSAATLAIIIALASKGLITLDAGVALALGANIGTCITAATAAIGRPREAVRAAAAHVLFKTVGVLLVLPALGPFIDLVTWLSPPELTRQLANMNTLFNVFVALFFLPLTAFISWLLTRLIPDKPLGDEEVRPQYLDDFLLATPSLALTAVRNEIRRMGSAVMTMMNQIMPAVLKGSPSELDALRKHDERVDSLHALIVSYLGALSKLTLNEKQTREMMAMMYISHDLESIGDLMETNLVSLGYSRLDHSVTVSDQTAKVLLTIHNVILNALSDSLKAVSELDRPSAERVIAMKRDVRLLVDKAIRHQAERLVAPEANRINTYAVEMDIIDKLQRIYYHTRRMARTVIDLTADSQPTAQPAQNAPAPQA